MTRDDTVIFVGSGLSVWSGLPTWKGLIEALGDELGRLGRSRELVDKELASQDLLLAASYGMDQLTPQERRSFLRSSLKAEVKPSEIHELLAQLGPSSFITTNYDSLIEQALASHRPGEYFDVVTSANTLEIPSIIRARADHFVFKPHGDISNSQSVILTREDYRQFQHENRAVFEAVRTLLASRPVVYIGFGLRDPDFLLMRDMLFGTFGSNPSDHFAIMPDVHDAEGAYWRKHYGIDLISYETDPSAALDRRHASLLDLLRDIARGGEQQQPEVVPTASEALTLSLARYARGLHAGIPEAGSLDIPLTTRALRDPRQGRQAPLRVDGEAIAVLSSFHGHLVIEGPPGGGKSHTARKLARYLAKALEDACLGSDGAKPATLRVPVLVPMRDYRGSIIELLESSLPRVITPEVLLSNTEAVIILDGLNEAPGTGEHGENALASQVEELLSIASESTVLITTRFAGQLSSIKLPVAVLDAVSVEALTAALDEAGLDVTQMNPVTFDILRRPLVFSSWKNGQVTIAETYTIHDVYTQIIKNLQDTIASECEVSISLPNLLGRVAFGMVDSGDLSASLAQVLSSLKQSLPPGVVVEDFYRILIEKQVLIPTRLRRLAFYHHSITEYLASSYLAKRIAQDVSVVSQCLGRKDWDQTLLMSLAFLEPGLGDEVYEMILGIDAALGLRGLHYVEVERDAWIQRALGLLPRFEQFPKSYELSRELASLPFAASHVRLLDSISNRDDEIGATAAALVGVYDNERLDDVLGLLVDGRRGYNFCTTLAGTLASFVRGADVLRILDMVEEVVLSNEDEIQVLAGEELSPYLAVQASISELLEDVPSEAIVERATASGSALVRVIAGSMIRDRRESAGAEYLRQEILAGRNYAIFNHYMQLEYGQPENTPLPSAPEMLLERVIDALMIPTVGLWAVNLLELLGRDDAEAKAWIGSRASTAEPGLVSCLLHYANGDSEAFASSLAVLARSKVDWSAEPTHCLEGIHTWNGVPILDLLRTRDLALVKPLLEAVAYPSADIDELQIESRELGWWLDWLSELAREDETAAGLLGVFLACQTTHETRRRLLDVFAASPALRPLLAKWVLSNFEDTSFANLPGSAVDWLLANTLAEPEVFGSTILLAMATEDLVQERIIPQLLALDDENAKADLLNLLEHIGERHGRRYVGDNGEVLP